MHQETLNTGIAIGNVVGFQDGAPLVICDGSLGADAVRARTIAALTPADVGAQVALSFEGGDLGKPLILGKIMRPTPPQTAEVQVDDAPPEVLEITGEREVVLRCGKASITLTKAGKILLRGTYISSRSSGVNRIKGGSVQLN